jgi:hypothetical protein
MEDSAMEATTPRSKREWRMPFRYWKDRDTQQFLRKQPEMADPHNCHKLLSWKGPDGKAYLYNNKNRAYMTAEGPFKPPFRHMEEIEDRYPGADAFVLCPGPSLADFDLELLRGKLTLCVNSAGFKVDHGLFWVTMESSYTIFLNREQVEVPKGRTWIQSSRCAVRWRHWGWGKTSRAVYVGRWEEEWIMPHRTPAVCTMGALTAAWWMGAKRIFVVGMDLSKPRGQSYVKGVPYSDYGASNPFDEQLLALNQFSMPGVEVFNGSPHSREAIRCFTPSSYREIEAAAKEAPAVSHPLDLPPVGQEERR